MKPTTYEGFRFNNHPTVIKQIPNRSRVLLSPYNNVRNHGAQTFDWGSNGSGASQLAFAILYDITKDEELSLQLYKQFKQKVVLALPDNWKLTSSKIKAELRKIWKDIYGR